MAHLVVACGGVVDESLAIISTKMAWIFLRWTKRRCNGCKGSPDTPHTGYRSSRTARNHVHRKYIHISKKA